MISSADQHNERLIIRAAGDVWMNREDPASIFALSGKALKEADIAFCQLEGVFSKRGFPQVHKPTRNRADPATVSGLIAAGFDVISVAGNHTKDFGDEALLDTVDTLRQNNISPIGAGKNLAEARQPAILNKKATRIAFLAYNAILPAGFEAHEDTPGCAPLKVYTFYEQVDVGQPGTPARIHTFADTGDLNALLDDVRKAKAIADVVIVSIHWGIHFQPMVIAEYQVDVGHAVIDAGADLILGGHAHILKGIEAYKGKVIFYSLGNFAFDYPPKTEAVANPRPQVREMKKLYGDAMAFVTDYGRYSFPPASRKTLLVEAIVRNKQIERVSFMPAYINKEAQPELLSHNDKRFDEVRNYISEVSSNQGLPVRFAVEDDQVIILP